MPNTDLREMLKMYGDAEVTVSTEMFRVAPEVVDGSAFAGGTDT